MSYNNFLNNKTLKSADDLAEFSILDMQNRDSNDYFFNKSDLEKMDHFMRLIERYKLCNKSYYYFNEGSKLWIEENTEDSVINRICQETEAILTPEKKHVLNILYKLEEPLENKKKDKSITESETEKLNEITTAIKEFNKFIDKTIKEHQKTKFARSVLSFFHHKITDPEFMEKININNHHLLPLRRMNLNLKTMKMEERNKEQHFTRCLNIDNIAEYENVIKGIPSKVALTTVKKEYWTIISDKSRNVSHYIKLKTKYLAPICDLLTTDPKAIKQCLIEFATNGWLYFFKQISKKVSLREIKAILLKHKCTKVELETSPRQRIIYNIELGVSDSLPETLPEPLPESETYGGRQYKKPRKSSASATKRRPRRKSSAIKHRRRRTSRK